MCSGAALPSAHSTTARSGTCASARASDTHTPGRLLLLRTDDQQTDTDCDTLHCARASARARRGGTTTADFNSTHTGEPLHKGAGPPPRRAGNQPTDSDHDTPDCARSRARLDDNNTSADDTPDCARSRARSDESNTTDEDPRDSARSRARSDDSNERQKRDRGSTPGAAAQHRGAVHPLVSSTHRAASADAVARLALASENEQRGGGGLEATRIRTKVQATTTQRGAEGARRKRRSSKTTSLRNHEKLRRAVFEHRHHRKQEGTSSAGDTTGRHQQRWRGPETRSHRTAVVGKRVYTLYKDR